MNHQFELVNLDTDSISIRRADHSPITEDDRAALLAELNKLLPEKIQFADDGYYPKLIVIRAKNYIMLKENGKVNIKGSGLKATTKEKALKRFLDEVIQLLLSDNQDGIYSLYMQYAREILALKDMAQWCSKHTITKAVLTGKGTAQVRLREALKGRSVQEGDKVYMFFKSDTERCLLEDFDGTYCKDTLLGKLYDTLCVFETVLDVKQYPNLTLKRNKAIREQLEVSNAMV